MNIEKFYYDEQEKMIEEMKREMEEHDQSLSPEEREKERKKSLQEARAIMENAEQKKRCCKISEICLFIGTGYAVFKNLRMQYKSSDISRYVGTYKTADRMYLASQ